MEDKKCQWCNSNFGYYRFSDDFWVCRRCGYLTKFKIMKGGVDEMGFKRIEKRFRGGSFLKIKDNQVSVSKSYIAVNRNFFEAELKKPFLEVYIDKERKLIGLKPSDDDIKGFKVQMDNKNKKTVATITPREVIRAIASGLYDLKWDFSNEIYYFEVKEIAEKKP